MMTNLNDAAQLDVLARKRSMPTCRKCQNHGEIIPLRGHKKECPFRVCPCSNCNLIERKRKVMAKEVAFRRSQQIDSLDGSLSTEASYFKGKICCMCCECFEEGISFLQHLELVHQIHNYYRCLCNVQFSCGAIDEIHNHIRKCAHLMT